jgi:hypothetical protein
VVDKYIASGVDSRPRFEIEAAAKIGVSLGAMCRVCEADSCTKMEGREIQKLSTCSRCQMVWTRDCWFPSVHIEFLGVLLRDDVPEAALAYPQESVRKREPD